MKHLLWLALLMTSATLSQPFPYFPPPGMQYSTSGGLLISPATGGLMGAGTVNASGLFVNGIPVSGGGGTPGGLNQQIQFNQAGSFGGNANLTWDYTNSALGLNASFGSAGNVAISGGAGVATTWGQLDLSNANAIKNTLPIGNLPAIGANPTALVGLTAVPGAATTCVRSDGAPALNQTIAPTWTGAHIFTAQQSNNSFPVELSSAHPDLGLNNTAGGANAKLWDISAGLTLNHLTIFGMNDAGTTTATYIDLVRNTTSPTAAQINIGNTVDNPTINLRGPVVSSNTLTLASSTVAALPTCNAGLNGSFRAVSDATAPTYNAALVGGGTVSVPVYCNGSAWTSH